MPCPAYPAVSDQTLLGRLQDTLLEPNNGGSSLATNQFSISQLINSLQQASLDFERDTGVVACHVGFQGDTLDGIQVSSGQEQVDLPQDCMDVRRSAWISFGPGSINSGGVVYYDDETPQDSGDHQNFTLTTAPNPPESLMLFESGQLLQFGVDYTLTGTAIALAGALGDPAIVRWTLQAFYRDDTDSSAVFFDNIDLGPLDSGDHQHFTLPAVPNPAASLQLFLNGLLLAPGATKDYVLAGSTVTLNYSLGTGPWTLIAYFRYSVPDIYRDNVTPADSGNHRIFNLPVAPLPGLSLQLYLGGQLMQPGGGDYTLFGAQITFSYVLAAPFNLQAYYRFTNQAAGVKAVVELPVQDSLGLDSSDPEWESELGEPYTSDQSLPPLPSLNLSYQPQDVGALDLIYTPVPNPLSNTGVPLSFPPDFSIPVFYRALQILYSLQGEGADDQRARYCGERYNLLVQISKALMFLPNMVGV